MLSFNVEPGIVSVPDCIKHSEKGETMDTQYVALMYFIHAQENDIQ